MITVITNLEINWDALIALAMVGILCGWMWVISGWMFKGHCWLLGTSPDELTKTGSDIDTSSITTLSNFSDSDSGSF